MVEIHDRGAQAMTGKEPSAVLRNVRTLFGGGTVSGLTDGQLLERFLARHDDSGEAAFTALVQRHGPMVWGVCKRLLHDPNDAADAFQATFLVLVHRAATVRGDDALGRWLYGVSRKVAARTKKMSDRRSARERRGVERVAAPAPPLDSDPGRAEWLAVLDEEIGRLPQRYREVVVLCDLGGLRHDEAARQLGCAVGTIGSRVSRARERLRARLTRRGFAPPAGLLTGALFAEAATAAMPSALAATTVRTAVLISMSQAAAVSIPSVALTKGVLRAMFMTRLRSIAVAFLTIVAGACGTVVLAFHQASEPAEDPPSRQKPTQDPSDRAGRPPGQDTLGASHRASADRSTPVRDEKSPQADPKPAQSPAPDAGDQGATRLALGAHSQAASIDKLPRFSYQVQYRHGVVDSMRAVDVTIDRLKQALTAPVLDKDWFGRYRTSFSWDESRFLWEMSPGEADLNFDSRFWTRTDAWERHEAKDRSSVNFVRSAGPSTLWKHLILFDYSYLRLTPHRFWWGTTAQINHQTMSLVPPEKVSWKRLGAENFGGEMCEIVDSAQRTERLWIGQGSGHVRGVLTYGWDTNGAKAAKFYQTDAVRRIAGKWFISQRGYSNWLRNEATEDQLTQVALAWSEPDPTPVPGAIEPNELVLFDDYREVSPGIWIPFREIRAFPHASETARNKHQLIRSELSVDEVRTDLSLAGRFDPLMPKHGERVQDQRFIVPIDYDYRADRGDEEIRELAGIEYNKRLKGEEYVRRLTQPIDAMVGKPAPALPTTGWIGGRRPDLAGKPYLLHFWATWCGPCKNDLPRLKALAERGIHILGMHPSGTSREEVENFLRDQQLNYPTFLAPANMGEPGHTKIGDYPAGVFPYGILVDAQGRVAGHGSLSKLLETFGTDALISPAELDSKKSGQK
jgi:RNA polymerase sigma factor (sigma-70 family)